MSLSESTGSKGFANTTPDLAEKAVASEGGTTDAKKRGEALAQAFKAHLSRFHTLPFNHLYSILSLEYLQLVINLLF